MANAVARTPPKSAASDKGMSPISRKSAGMTGMISPIPMESITVVSSTNVSGRRIAVPFTRS